MDWKNEFAELLFPSDESLPKDKEAYELKYINRPKSIFKFRGVNKEIFQKYLDEIKDDTIWLARPDSFNDPYDCFFKGDFQKTLFEYLLRTNSPITKEISTDQIKEFRHCDRPVERMFQYVLAKKGNFNKENLEVLKENFQKNNFEENIKYMNGTVKVCCFSERNDSIPMWAHYADDHKGFCIEYDIYDQPKDLIQFLFPIIYADEITDITNELSKGVMGWGIKPTIHKSQDWSYEKEWRFIKSTPLVPAVKGASLKFIPIKAIYLGTDICDEDKSKLVEIADTKNIPVYKMKMSDTRFAFQPVPIS